MSRITALVLALSALSGCGRAERPAPAPPAATEIPAFSPISPAVAAPPAAFCLVAIVKDDKLAYSVWLAWQDETEEWRHERMFGLRPGAVARHAVARAKPRTDYWLLLCDPGGLETEDFVHIGYITGTEAAPMAVVYAAKDGKITLIDEPAPQ